MENQNNQAPQLAVDPIAQAMAADAARAGIHGQVTVAVADAHASATINSPAVDQEQASLGNSTAVTTELAPEPVVEQQRTLDVDMDVEKSAQLEEKVAESAQPLLDEPVLQIEPVVQAECGSAIKQHVVVDSVLDSQTPEPSSAPAMDVIVPQTEPRPTQNPTVKINHVADLDQTTRSPAVAAVTTQSRKHHKLHHKQR